MKAASIAALSLLTTASVFGAEPAIGKSSKTCDPQTTSIRKLIRQARSVGGPVAKRVQKLVRVRVRPRTAHIEVARRAATADASQAIQNDTPITHVAVLSLTLELRPLGLFVGPLERLPFTISLSPRAPRGPPVSA